MSERGFIGFLLSGLILSLVMACFVGTYRLPVADVFAALAGGAAPGDRVVIWDIRLPRALAAASVGFCLGLCGAALQGLLRNPLAEPGVLGVSAAASLAATTTIYYGLFAVTPLLLPLSAIAGALLAMMLLLSVARRRTSVVTLVLVGVGLSSLSGAAMSLLLNLAPNPFTLSDMINWSLGSVANRSVSDIALALPFMVLGCAILFRARHGLTALAIGEAAAVASGVDIVRLRWMIVLGAGLVTGAAVSLAGAIGFVGLIAPHLIRPCVASVPAKTLMPAGLVGATLLVLADIGVRLLPTSNELNLGVVAALLGAPVFIMIVMRRGASMYG